jgi:hypothetical protein
VSVFQLDTEHRVGQWLDHRAFEHDGIFLGLGQVTLLTTSILVLLRAHRWREAGTGRYRMWPMSGNPKRDLAQDQRIILP